MKILLSISAPAVERAEAALAAALALPIYKKPKKEKK